MTIFIFGKGGGLSRSLNDVFDLVHRILKWDLPALSHPIVSNRGCDLLHNFAGLVQQIKPEPGAGGVTHQFFVNDRLDFDGRLFIPCHEVQKHIRASSLSKKTGIKDVSVSASC